LNAANESLTSNPDDVIANMENSETDNGTTFNATLFANETFSVSYLNETSSNTTEESLTINPEDVIVNMETSATTDNSTSFN
jgi:hypothetical protein